MNVKVTYAVVAAVVLFGALTVERIALKSQTHVQVSVPQTSAENSDKTAGQVNHGLKDLLGGGTPEPKTQP